MASKSWLAVDAPLRSDAPHRRAGGTHRHILRAWMLAGALVGLSGAAFHGWRALLILALTIVSTFAVDLSFVLATRRASSGRLSRTFLVGLIAGLTLPVNVELYVPIACGALSAFVGNIIFGGWLHPALVGRVLVQFIFLNHSSLAVMGGAVLLPSYIFTGDPTASVATKYYDGWLDFEGEGAQAIELQSPQRALRAFAEGKIPPDGGDDFEPLLRDVLPPWTDAVLGAVPGGIGETSLAAILIVGFFLIYRGYLKWQLPASIFIAAFVTVAILPVALADGYRWFPVFEVENGRAVGLAYCVYHLAAGQLALVAFLIAGDMHSSPMRVQGQILFGVGIGTITIFMRLYGVVECEAYWAVLIMNMAATSIDRITRRRTLGTHPPREQASLS